MIRLTCLAALVSTVFTVTPAAAQGSASCKVVTEALLKLPTTPHHATSTISGQTQPVESITAGGNNYVRLNGTWTKSRFTPQDEIAQEQENVKESKVYTCHPEADQNVGGVAAAVFTVHTERDDVGKSDSKVWIAKTTGLPLRTETTLDGGSIRSTAVYDYVNITAPAVK